jgi:NAD(P)-dependent dehydrogenase (short-subunit alcohol dehydrogenase family)
MANLFCVKDKVVIITGGAGILGRGIAGHLAEEGAKIVILDRAAEVGEQIVADIKAKGGEASFFLTDVLNKEILEQISSQTSGLVSVGYLMAKGG